MYRSAKHILPLLLLVIISSTSYAQRLETYFLQDSISSGEIFDLSLVLYQDTLYSDLSFPDSSSFNGDFYIRNRQQFRLNDLTDSLHLEIQYFGTNDIDISPLAVKLSKNNEVKTLYSDPIRIPYKNLVTEQEPVIRPSKPIFQFPDAIWPYLVAFMFGAAMAYALYRYYQKMKEQTDTAPVFTPPPFIDPLKRLEDQLEALKMESNLAETKDFKFFYIQLGDALRLYFEDLYQIPALESTTREMIRFVDVFGVEPDMKKITRSVLMEADMVKFAKFTPTMDQAWKAHKLGLDFLLLAKNVDSIRIEKMRERHFAKYAPKPEPEPETEVIE